MLNNTYIYSKDYNKKFSELDRDQVKKLFGILYEYKSMSTKRRSVVEEYTDSSDTNSYLAEILGNFEKLVKENQLLHKRVHELGIKNRIRKLLGRYRSPEVLPSPVSQNIVRLVADGNLENEINYENMAIGNKISDILSQFFGDKYFEEYLEDLQKDVAIPRLDKEPLVSIIIPTRNGISHLRRLFSDFDQNIQYSNYEVIVVDNASSDKTVNFVKSLNLSGRVKLIINPVNKSFSESNNVAAGRAKGDYLLFLNNDIKPVYGWLNHMLNTATQHKKIGAVGAKLIYPRKADFDNSLKIQHGGIGFNIEKDFIRPVNINNGVSFLSANTITEEEKSAVTAACLLIKKTAFQSVGGFDESYWYGYEDVDLCLKLKKEGFINVINNAAVLYHYEFGTQEENSIETISGYRKENMKIFKDKWQKKLYIEYWKSLLAGDGVYTNKKMPHICFITTEASENTAAGDFFTAKELAHSLNKKGCKTSFIGMRDSSYPFDIDSDVDVVVSMIDGYDISKITEDSFVKIAWCRNWFERWAEHDYFRDFDIVLTNSEKASQFFLNDYGIESHIFNIATNAERFTKKYDKNELEKYYSDICFTGNYWHDPRSIIEQFSPSSFPEKTIKFFGRDWDLIDKFKPYHQGFIKYNNIPKVYASGKILIDDATWIVDEWGSVNSRIFDGAASGILVLTNGAAGNKSTLDGKFPTFKSEEELNGLINYYLSSEDAYKKKVNELRQYILENHTYDMRAEQLLEILKSEEAVKKINIKIPVPSWDQAQNWGDTHFANSIRKELRKLGYSVRLHSLSEWNKGDTSYANLVLRGLSEFQTPSHQLNIMWNISHPEAVALDEYKSYDYVFVASKKHAKALRNKGVENVTTLYQCYDPSVFNTNQNDKDDEYSSDILFVGNSRNVYREAIKGLMSWKNKDKYKISVYGKDWSKFIDDKYIAGEFVPNDKLSTYYRAAKIVLNDHWDDMRKYRFVSNRLFDAPASGAFVISDKNGGIDEIFGKNVIPQFKNEADLHKLLNHYLENPKDRHRLSLKANDIITENHSFHARIETLVNTVEEL